MQRYTHISQPSGLKSDKKFIAHITKFCCHSKPSWFITLKVCDLGFILETCHDQILADLNNKEVAATLSTLEIAEIGRWGEKNDYRRNPLIFKTLNPFPVDKYWNLMTASICERVSL